MMLDVRVLWLWLHLLGVTLWAGGFFYVLMIGSKIYSNISYPFPVHLMRGYSYLKYKKGNFPITEKLSKRIFSLPMYPQLNNSMILKVVKSLKGAGI